ncbi:permease-like cell division protein FtsX [Dactylosporangium sp. NPDC051541]|uniref:permease-like cell division protein FtsX n=1 Tax=Dactylosporangium sp. NPDC051541 TaxID=3363977 RepID=UPI0037B93688
MTVPEPEPDFTPALIAEPPAAPVPPAPPKRRRWLILTAVAVPVLLIVAAAGFAGGYLAGRPAAELYSIHVYFKQDVSEGDKAAVRRALEALGPDTLRLVSKEEAASRAQETFKDYPEALKTMTAENLPESFEAEITTREFTCKGVTPIGKMTGVDDLVVGKKYHGDVPGAQIGC